MRGRWLVAIACASLAGCAAPLHAEMMGESIKLFTSKLKAGPEKVWISGPDDSACDAGCQNGCGGGRAAAGKPAHGGGFFGGGRSTGISASDRLAYEVFSNYLTQKKKMQVIESHRHNYSTQLNAATRQKMDVINEAGKVMSSGMSCEDLCLLDEAKKRKADKVLVYHVVELSNEEMKIHFRLSDVPTGLVEASQTIKVFMMRAFDASPASFSRGSRGDAAPAPAAAAPAAE